MERMPCIVLSGDAMPAHMEQALAAGLDDYWSKPVDIWQLMTKIDDIAPEALSTLLRRGSHSTEIQKTRQI